ncbi:hypothetical protein [Streptomyces termitum]|uniref:hypothetical protein n=1 Tax=Streptomyces termitum TaxID=67368 RepID=UPI0037BC64A3
MDDEIQLFKDADGLMVVGDEAAVQRFLVSEGLPSKGPGTRRLGTVLGGAAGLAQTASERAAESGLWMKVTKESARRMEKSGLRKSAATGLETGVLKGPKGQVGGFVEFAKGAGPLKSNPTQLANVAAVMAQLAMQQAMDEITDYLAAIDEKVDDVLRAQKDQSLAQMIAVDFALKEAITVRDRVGRVSEVTWSKLQNAPTAVLYTQAYALRRLDALAEKTERKNRVGELAKAAREIETEVRQWLAVLAHCFQLQDAFSVLELDRVRETDPHELDAHRLGLKAARKNRMDLISESTERLMDRMHTAAGTANAKVLLHPTASREVVHARNHVEVSVVDFHGRLGIERDQESLEARRWKEAAVEVRDKALEKGAENVEAARRLGTETLDRAKSATSRLSSGLAERTRRRREGDAENEAGEEA